MKNTQFLLILLPVALVCLCCLGLLLIGLASISLPAIDVLATSTPLPAHTPAPTPRSTPTATASLTPTPTATRPSLRLQRYSLEIAATNEVLSQALRDLAELLQDPQLADQGWKREVAIHVATIERVGQELTHMEVPVEMIGVHSGLIDAMFDCDGVRFFLADVDNLSLSEARIAGRLVASCNEKFSKQLQTIEQHMR